MRSEIWAGWKRFPHPPPFFSSFQLGEFSVRSVPWASPWCSCMLSCEGMIWRQHKNRLKAQTGETLPTMPTRCSLNDLWGSSSPTVNKSPVRQCLQQSWGSALGKKCSSSNICSRASLPSPLNMSKRSRGAKEDEQEDGFWKGGDPQM